MADVGMVTMDFSYEHFSYRGAVFQGLIMFAIQCHLFLVLVTSAIRPMIAAVESLRPCGSPTRTWVQLVLQLWSYKATKVSSHLSTPTSANTGRALPIPEQIIARLHKTTFSIELDASSQCTCFDTLALPLPWKSCCSLHIQTHRPKQEHVFSSAHSVCVYHVTCFLNRTL